MGPKPDLAKGSVLGHDKAKETVIFTAHHDTAPGCFLLEDSIVDLAWKFSRGIASYLEGLCLQSLIDRMVTELSLLAHLAHVLSELWLTVTCFMLIAKADH